MCLYRDERNVCVVTQVICCVIFYLDDPPLLWGRAEVRDWLIQYIQVYNLQHLKMTDFDMTGAQLCKLTQEEFCWKAGKQVGEKMFDDLAKRNKGGFIFMFT